MILTNAQKLTLQADIAVNVNTILVAGVPTAIKDVLHIADLAPDVATWYNGLAVPDFIVWRDLPMDTVRGLVTLAAMTPADAVPTSDALAVAPLTSRVSYLEEGDWVVLHHGSWSRASSALRAHRA